ncbi:unnamed protein product [Plutella xylostella]|uniref:(diamondback moth) hypothetical protein n=1 Tax=Plutella xylostella TaxID=51655 RepID=A0A8S4GAD0_PLUXY|nr:unnamed protein product [Plutella xylostella]
MISHALSESDISKVGERSNKRPRTEDSPISDFALFTREIREMLSGWKAEQDASFKKLINEVSDLKAKLLASEKINAEITKSMDFMNSNFEEMRSQFQKSEAEKNLEICQLKEDLANVKFEFNLQQQRERLDNIEITGIPEKSNENLSEYLVSLAKTVGVELTSDDIIHINRVQPRTNTSGRPKTIIAKLKLRNIKDAIISGARKNRGLTSVDLRYQEIRSVSILMST